MIKFKGFDASIKSERYRKTIGLPDKVTETYTLLAHGENNVNYIFTHPITARKLILRINSYSQIYLADQISYEANALKLLESSGRTPEVLYHWAKDNDFEYGALVMEYLPGHGLDYKTDLEIGAEALADIHSVELPSEDGLIHPESPLKAILDECEQMFKIYTDSPLADRQTEDHIRMMLDLGWKRLNDYGKTDRYMCCVNTELNNMNFLINGAGKPNYIIDWEKPLYSEPAQDLGHYLAPTTTYWKTDIILDDKTVEETLDAYIKAVGGRFFTDDIKERTYAYIPITCLRGITYCAKAWVQYHNHSRLIMNKATEEKLDVYLDEKFLTYLEAWLSR